MTNKVTWVLPTYRDGTKQANGIPQAFRSLGFRPDLQGPNESVYGLPVHIKAGDGFSIADASHITPELNKLYDYAAEHKGRLNFFPFEAKNGPAVHDFYSGLLIDAPSNIKLPTAWTQAKPLIAVFGGRVLSDTQCERLQSYLSKITANLPGKLSFALPDSFGPTFDCLHEFCKRMLYEIRTFPPRFNAYGHDSFKIRNYHLAFEATHAVVVEDSSADTDHFKFLCERFDIPMRVFKP